MLHRGDLRTRGVSSYLDCWIDYISLIELFADKHLVIVMAEISRCPGENERLNVCLFKANQNIKSDYQDDSGDYSNKELSKVAEKDQNNITRRFFNQRVLDTTLGTMYAVILIGVFQYGSNFFYSEPALGYFSLFASILSEFTLGAFCLVLLLVVHIASKYLPSDQEKLTSIHNTKILLVFALLLYFSDKAYDFMDRGNPGIRVVCADKTTCESADLDLVARRCRADAMIWAEEQTQGGYTTRPSRSSIRLHMYRCVLDEGYMTENCSKGTEACWH